MKKLIQILMLVANTTFGSQTILVDSTTKEQENPPFVILTNASNKLGGSEITAGTLFITNNLQFIGMGRVTNYVSLGASEIEAPGTDAATQVVRGTGLAWQFADGATNSVNFNIPLPADADRTVPMTLELLWDTAAISQTGAWSIAYLLRAQNESLLGTPDLSTTNFVISSGTANGLTITPLCVVTAGTSDVTLHNQLKRWGSLAGDSLDDTAQLEAVRLRYAIGTMGITNSPPPPPPPWEPAQTNELLVWHTYTNMADCNLGAYSDESPTGVYTGYQGEVSRIALATNYYLDYDGINDRYRIVSNDYDFCFTDGYFTVSAWIWVADTNSTADELINNWTANAGWRISTDDDRLWAWTYDAGGDDRSYSERVLVTNRWQHIAWVHSNTTKTIYIDGTNQTSSFDAGKPLGSGLRPITVGGPWSSGVHWPGLIDQLMIYGTNLTETQIRTNMEGTRNGK